MVGKYEVEIYEDGDGSFYYIDPDSGEEVTCDKDGNSLSIPPIPKQVQFVGAPEEWKELEKIDKDAEVEDYCENGIWDIDGIRDDLALMRGKLGIKAKRQESPRQGEWALATASSYVCSMCGKGYPEKWSLSPCCGKDMQPRDSPDVAPKPSPSPAPKAAAARKVAKKRKVVKKRKVRKKAKRPAAPPDKSGGTSKMQELRELLEMKKEGLIDDDEFKQLKKEILGK